MVSEKPRPDPTMELAVDVKPNVERPSRAERITSPPPPLHCLLLSPPIGLKSVVPSRIALDSAIPITAVLGSGCVPSVICHCTDRSLAGDPHRPRFPFRHPIGVNPSFGHSDMARRGSRSRLKLKCGVALAKGPMPINHPEHVHRSSGCRQPELFAGETSISVSPGRQKRMSQHLITPNGPSVFTATATGH
jgi:hypothetical protein